MENLSRRDLIKLAASSSAAIGAGAVGLPALAGCGDDSDDTDADATPSPPAQLTGRVVRPRDRGYDRARRGWDRLFSSYPLAIVFCKSTQDVVNALTWSRQNDVAVRVRSGRHHLAGWSSVDGGLVVDVSGLKDTRIDAARKTAVVGAGLTQGEIVAALGKRGFTVPTGSEGTVGVAGATLGGGFGFFTRSMGMTCDNLLGVEMVVPSGSDGAKALRADESSDGDLLWACRGGGGGNFGIATSFTFGLHQISKVAVVTATWKDHNDLKAVFEVWQRESPRADEQLTSVLEVNPNSILLIGVLRSGSAKEAKDLLAPLLKIGKPDVEAGAKTWPEVFAGFQTPRETANWLFNSAFVSAPFPAEAIELVGKYMAKAPAPPSNFFCSSFGGAVRSEPAGGSAFPHREALFYCEPGAGWNGDRLTARSRAWMAEFSQALRPYVDGAYVNVPNVAMADWETAYYGSKYRRLREIKAKYDPDDIFHFEQSIPPAAS